MSEELIIKHCSPTLASIKTANMFTYQYENKKQLTEQIRTWNNRLKSKGLCVLPLKYLDNKALIYIYRPKKLSEDLKNPISCSILSNLNYRKDNLSHCLIDLIKRLNSSDSFPHEIGLFLGYPPEDVKAFIENKATNCKCVGCWKAYTNIDQAEKTFARYKKCTALYCKQLNKGFTIDKLAVAS